MGSTRRVQKTNKAKLMEREQELENRDGTASLQQRVAPPPVTTNNSSNPSIPSGEGIHYISMEGVIPNSKVVIIPPNTPGFGEWRRELYLRPGEWIPWVTVTLVVATLILGIIVYAFHWNERVRIFLFPIILVSPNLSAERRRTGKTQSASQYQFRCIIVFCCSYVSPSQ